MLSLPYARLEHEPTIETRPQPSLAAQRWGAKLVANDRMIQATPGHLTRSKTQVKATWGRIRNRPAMS
jgi:hypothetical protein